MCGTVTVELPCTLRRVGVLRMWFGPSSRWEPIRTPPTSAASPLRMWRRRRVTKAFCGFCRRLRRNSPNAGNSMEGTIPVSRLGAAPAVEGRAVLAVGAARPAVRPLRCFCETAMLGDSRMRRRKLRPIELWPETGRKMVAKRGIFPKHFVIDGSRSSDGNRRQVASFGQLRQSGDGRRSASGAPYRHVGGGESHETGSHRSV